MLHCRACLSRCTRALDTSPLQTQLFRRDGPSALVATQTRSASTSTRDASTGVANRSWKLSTAQATDGRPPEGRDPWNKSAAAKSLRRREDQALRRPVDREGMKREAASGEMWLGKRDPRMTPAEWDRRRRELHHLHDPLQVAAFVRQQLAKGKSKEMLQLVRMASHSMQVVVSWNHIIDHLMKTSVSAAMKVYNEMKKRAQFPDSHTYTILLRGLSSNADQSGVTSKAIAIYHSMSAPNSKVEPSIIHTNAVLTVCARALDMDALWGFAGKIPESGPGAADARTFTIILNAIRQSLLVDAPIGESEHELAHRRDRGIVEGRRIWEDVVGKWRNADLIIEEELVTAMGRLLLVGSRPRDWDDVLSLVEQTMDIPRFVPRLGTIAREALPRLRLPNTPEELKFDDDHLSPDKGPMRGEEFLAITEIGTEKQAKPLTYASPGNDTLSMVLEACQKIVAPKAAEDYWETLIDPGTYAVVPDNNNLHQRLRLLRTNRASTATLHLLQDKSFAKQLVLKPGTFRIAMSTCVRDKNNHNSLRNASQLLQLMMQTLPDADAKTSAKYAELAVAFPLATGEDLVEALTYLQPVMKSLKIQLNIGKEKAHGTTRLSSDARDDAITALRKIYAVFDRLLHSNMIPEEQKPSFKAERSRLSALLQRILFKDSNRNTPRHNEEGNVVVEQRRERVRHGGRRASRATPSDARQPWPSTSTA